MTRQTLDAFRKGWAARTWPCTQGDVSRLPALDESCPFPISMADAARLIPGYDAFGTAPPGATFDEDRAALACGFFFDCLKHVKGRIAGRPFVLQLWEQAIIANVYGWRMADGTRRYREAMLYVPRKNGKTPLAAGVTVLELVNPRELGAEIYSAAAEREQAALIYSWVKGYVDAEPELAARLRYYRAGRSVENEATGGVYRALSADADTKHGFNTSCYVMDEVHAQKNRNLLDALETSTSARREPFGLLITTADFDRPSICNEKLAYAQRVRDGVVDDPEFLPVIYETLREADWHDEATWRAANPNFGISVSEREFARDYRKACESAAYQNTFKRLRLNMVTESEVAWVDLGEYDKGAGAIDVDALRGEVCYGGLDLASTSDLTAFVLWFPRKGVVLPWFWVPEDTARKRDERDRVPYLGWARDEYLHLTPGNVTDYAYVKQQIEAAAEAYRVQAVAFDRFNASQLVIDLQGEGLNMVPFGQGYVSMSAPTKELERLLRSGEVLHGGHPVMRWCAANTMLEQDAAGNVKPSKRRSKEKIDGVVAWVMALGASMAGKDKPPSAYAERGLRRL